MSAGKYLSTILCFLVLVFDLKALAVVVINPPCSSRMVTWLWYCPHTLHGPVKSMSLIDVFKLQEAQIAVKDDFRRVWAWTGTLASSIGEKEDVPHRTFEFDINELLNATDNL